MTRWRELMEHVHSQHVAADQDSVFAALAEPGNLARYEGRTQRGEAYFRADKGARRLEWGSGGGYRGWMTVEADGDGSMLTLGLHTTHIEHSDHDIAATLDAIRRLVEADI
jgi:hypothetical protein